MTNDGRMIPELTVFCVGRDNAGAPTHDRFGVAPLALDPQVGIVLRPTAQQRGNPQSAAPRRLTQAGDSFACLVCGDRVRVQEKRALRT